MLLNIQGKWINPDLVACVYRSGARAMVMFGNGFAEEVPMPAGPMDEAKEQAFVDEIAQTIANNQNRVVRNLPHETMAALAEGEIAGTCVNNRHVVHAKCDACECGCLSVGHRFKDRRVFDVRIAPEPIQYRSAPDADKARGPVDPIIHFFDSSAATAKIACGIPSGGASNEINDVNCPKCLFVIGAKKSGLHEAINKARGGEPPTERVAFGADRKKTVVFNVNEEQLANDRDRAMLGRTANLLEEAFDLLCNASLDEADWAKFRYKYNTWISTYTANMIPVPALPGCD